VRLRHRLYLQFSLAVLPLVLLVAYQALTRSDLPERVNAALQAYDLALDAVGGYGKFMDGVADAIDTGRIGGNSIAALGRARDDAAKLAALEQGDASLERRLDAIVGKVPANATIDAVMPLKAEMQSLRQQLADSAERRRAALSTLVQEEQDNARERRNLMIAGSAGALALLVFTAWFLRRLVRGITDPIGQCVESAHAIAEGRLDRRVESRDGRRDEMAQLLSAMAAMQDNLTGIVRAVRLRARSVEASSDGLSSETAALSQRSEEQAASLEEAAASMEELSVTVRGNAAHAREANALAGQAAEAALAGTEAVARVVETMRQISDSSRRIADIVGIIDSIAFQTNILALNAAVEAARAGEQGRGFAVVASEVRSLSQRCSTAATEIKELIGASVAHVEDGTRRVDEAGRSIQVLVEDVRKVSGLMGDIAGATVEQERGISQVSTSVTQMDSVVQRNAASAQECAATAERLTDDAQELAEAVSRFRLAEDAHLEPAARVLPAPGPQKSLSGSQSESWGT
jgi:methyl-accepting chemotaxis protein